MYNVPYGSLHNYRMDGVFWVKVPQIQFSRRKIIDLSFTLILFHINNSLDNGPPYSVSYVLLTRPRKGESLLSLSTHPWNSGTRTRVKMWYFSRERIKYRSAVMRKVIFIELLHFTYGYDKNNDFSQFSEISVQSLNLSLHLNVWIMYLKD